jgi:hypothetical protein
MRMKWAKIIAETCCSLLGTAMLIVAIFANQLHLDKNAAWGTSRIAMAILGGIFLILGITILMSSSVVRLFRAPSIQRITHAFRWINIPFTWLAEPREEKTFQRKTGWYAVAGALLVIFISTWYITSGRMVTWTPSTTYFDRLANAFLAGKLSLLEKPPAALATLENPYQYKNREGIGGTLWDSSYYKGNYYLYWGPVPGLMAAAAKIISPTWVVEDQYLVIFSIAGLACVLAALFYTLQKKYFPRIPGWVILGATLLGGLNTPVFWLVNRPHVYEVSIAMGQFFLILGLFTVVLGIESNKHQILFLTITGFAWGAAICTRLDLAPGIAWMTLLIFVWLIFQLRKRLVPASTLIALVLPLVLWGAGLAWYNFARFGNILETGHRYQLTGGALPANYRDVASISYILPNLYNLLARPMEIHWDEFPFFFTPFLRESMWPKYIFYPRNANYFYNEPIAGIFETMPTTWLLLIPIIIVPMRRLWHWIKEIPSGHWVNPNQPKPSLIAGMITGAALLNLGVLSIFIFSTMRYEADLTPLLATLFFMCVGWASIGLSTRPRAWNFILIIAGAAILITVGISLFTNFQNGDLIFRNNNPVLYQEIDHLFTGK